jgi:hypothetical protein
MYKNENKIDQVHEYEKNTEIVKRKHMGIYL